MPQLLVQPLNPNSKASFLAAIFEEHGPVEAIRLFLVGSKPKFAIVEMPWEHNAAQALRALNGSKLDGQPIEVVELGHSDLMLKFPSELLDELNLDDEDGEDDDVSDSPTCEEK
jgi:RNA recognition motif-containing protein